MKLWNDNFAPNLLAATGDAGSLNLTATKSEKGDRIILKAVNPSGEAAQVRVDLAGSVRPLRAAMQLVAPGSLSARNTLEQPGAVGPKPAQAALQGNTISFSLPPLSAGLVSVEVAR